MKLILGIVLLNLVIFAAHSFGEYEGDSVEAYKKEKEAQNSKTTNAHEGVEKLEVVGSRIRRVDMEGPSPLGNY